VKLEEVLRSGVYGLVIHIGAGRCRELDAYAEAGIPRIILIEPNPNLAERLRKREYSPGVLEVVEAAVAEASGTADLLILNVLEMSSLRTPMGLEQLYPNVAVRERCRVNVISIHDLVTRARETGGRRSLAIIDAPGEEGALVDAILSRTNGKAFSDLLVACMPDEAYAGAQPAGAIAARFEHDGYLLQEVEVANDLDRLWLLAQPSPTNQKIWLLEAEVAALKDQALAEQASKA
jgi:FkbM family methyltransferase